LPVVELVTDKLMVALFSGWNDKEREGEKKCAETEQGADFWPTLYPIFFMLKP